MIFFEYVFLQEFGSTGEFRIEISFLRNGFFQHVVLSGCPCEDIQQYADIGRSGRFVQADADLSGIEVTQVHLALQGDLTQRVHRHVCGKLYLQGIEIILV